MCSVMLHMLLKHGVLACCSLILCAVKSDAAVVTVVSECLLH